MPICNSNNAFTVFIVAHITFALKYLDVSRGPQLLTISSNQEVTFSGLSVGRSGLAVSILKVSFFKGGCYVLEYLSH